jgi:DNA-directed RNA polymerase subunit M/transcription elongation factor TFIIS
MGYINRFIAFFKNKTERPDAEPVGENDCSFCWGYQEYDHKTRLMSKDKQIDVKNHKDKHVKVGKFMVEHVDGFKNKKRIIERCPKCGGKRIKYKETPN